MKEQKNKKKKKTKSRGGRLVDSRQRERGC